MPRKSSVPIEVTAEERQDLWNLRRRSPKKRNWVRADIILRAASGQTNYIIAKELAISRNTVQHWRYRFAQERLVGLKTKPIPGRPKKPSSQEIQLAKEHLRMDQSECQKAGYDL